MIKTDDNMIRNRNFWIRVGVAILIVLLCWWLYMAMLVDEDAAFSACLTSPFSAI